MAEQIVGASDSPEELTEQTPDGAFDISMTGSLRVAFLANLEPPTGFAGALPSE